MEDKNIISRFLKIGLVLFILVFLLGLLMPALSTLRESAVRKGMQMRYEMPASETFTGAYNEVEGYPYATVAGQKDSQQQIMERTVPLAMVSKFDAEINLTPRLSVGTPTPESIYVADFKSIIEAKAPEKGPPQKCQIELPLPPHIISLADVNVTVNDEPSEDFFLGPNCLVWQGLLSNDNPTKISVTYSATGKGIYTLQKPAGKVIELFKTKLIANKSNIQMLQLSLQPNSLKKTQNNTIYTWEYKRLVAAQPIAIDVLGIAAIDRLERLTWLGPIGVFVFGVLIAVFSLAYDPIKLNGWVIVLVAGCFAAAYPMMYFLQDFMDLAVAVGIACAIALCIIGWRVISVCGLKNGIFGGLVLPAVMLLMTLAVAIASKRAVQGVLLTVLSIFVFVVIMILLPKVQVRIISRKSEQMQTAELEKETEDSGN